MKTTLEVLRFEIVRNLKKPSFWLVSLLLPVILGLYVGIVALSGIDAEQAMLEGGNFDGKTVAYLDDSGYIKIDEYSNSEGEIQKLTKVESKEAGIETVKNNEFDIFFYVPADFAPNPETGEQAKIEVHTKPEVISILDDYSNTINSFLVATALENVNPSDLIIIQGGLIYEDVFYDKEDNSVVDESEVISSMLAPGAALLFFYILICVLGNRLVVAMTEEKENRITELLLTSIKPISLIVGKVISLMILGLLQLVLLIVPIALFIFVANKMGAIPLDLQLQPNAGDIIQNTILLIASYYLFTALCIFIGVISPNAKDANSYSSIIVILVILPLIFMNLFITDNNPGLSGFFTFFPPSAPLAVMFRSLFGTISPLEVWIAITELFIVGTLVIIGSTKIYCKNAVNYTLKINFKKLLSAPRKTWKK